MRRSMVMRSTATDGRSVSECQGKRPDQFRERYSGRLEYREPAPTSGLGF
jgi:hypothetical protein